MRDASAVNSIISQLGLNSSADRRAGTLSHGNKQRLGLAKALLAKPELLILDEPANGLDPAGIVEIRELLRSLARDQGVTVFMSSHILSEVARLARRIGIIHQGRHLTELDADELDRQRRRKIVVDARDRAGARSVLTEKGFAPEGEQDGSLRLTEPGALERPDDVARLLVEGGHPPTLLRIDEEDLETYFLRLVRSRKEEGP
jgi:ABC-2 type transport system ATP-binding protein